MTHTETQAMCERLGTVTTLKHVGLSEEGWPEYERQPNVTCQDAAALLARQQEELNNADALQAESGAIISALYLEIAELTETAKRWERRATELAFERSAYRQAALQAKP